MTIKKTVSATRPTIKMTPTVDASADDDSTVLKKPVASEPVTPAIADRFKLDAPAKKSGGAAGLGTKLAVLAGVAALVVTGILTFILYQHWEYLMGA